VIKYRDLSNYVLLNKSEEPITVDMSNLIAFSESAFRDFKKVSNEYEIELINVQPSVRELLICEGIISADQSQLSLF